MSTSNLASLNLTDLPTDPRVNLEIYAFLPPKERQFQLEHINDNEVNVILISHSICLFIAYVAVALRFLARRINRAAYKADDWMILVSLASFTAFVSAILVCTLKYGAARHAILLKHPIPLAKGVIITECLYNPAIGFIKISTLALYGRIFTFQHVRRLAWALGLFIAAYSFANIFVTACQCQPVAAAWNPILRMTAKCINLGLSFQILSALNVASDIAILALPLPHLWRLQMPKSLKAQLMGLFGMGGFVTIVSIYRIHFLARVSLNDAAYDTGLPAIWSCIEISAATFCACGITYRPIVQKMIGVCRPRHKPASDEEGASPLGPAKAAGAAAEQNDAARGRGHGQGRVRKQTTNGTFTGLRSLIVGKWATDSSNDSFGISAALVSNNMTSKTIDTITVTTTTATRTVDEKGDEIRSENDDLTYGVPSKTTDKPQSKSDKPTILKVETIEVTEEQQESSTKAEQREEPLTTDWRRHVEKALRS